MAARVELIVPDGAQEGEQIKIDAYVTNDLGWTNDFWIQVIADEGIRDDLIINTQFPAAHGARAGPFTAYYTMPARDIIIHAYVLYWGFTEEMGWDWYYYDDVSKTVSLAAAPPPPPPCSILITAPDSAQEGERVDVSAKITNNSPNPQIYYTEIWEGSNLIGTFSDTIAGGSSETYPSSFIMPAYDTTIGVWVEVYYNGAWQYSNSDSKAVALYTPPPEPEFRGFALSEYTK